MKITFRFTQGKGKPSKRDVEALWTGMADDPETVSDFLRDVMREAGLLYTQSLRIKQRQP